MDVEFNLITKKYSLRITLIEDNANDTQGIPEKKLKLLFEYIEEINTFIDRIIARIKVQNTHVEVEDKDFSNLQKLRDNLNHVYTQQLMGLEHIEKVGKSLTVEKVQVLEHYLGNLREQTVMMLASLKESVDENTKFSKSEDEAHASKTDSQEQHEMLVDTRLGDNISKRAVENISQNKKTKYDTPSSENSSSESAYKEEHSQQNTILLDGFSSSLVGKANSEEENKSQNKRYKYKTPISENSSSENTYKQERSKQSSEEIADRTRSSGNKFKSKKNPRISHKRKPNIVEHETSNTERERGLSNLLNEKLGHAWGSISEAEKQLERYPDREVSRSKTDFTSDNSVTAKRGQKPPLRKRIQSEELRGVGDYRPWSPVRHRASGVLQQGPGKELDARPKFFGSLEEPKRDVSADHQSDSLKAMMLHIDHLFRENKDFVEDRYRREKSRDLEMIQLRNVSKENARLSKHSLELQETVAKLMGELRQQKGIITGLKNADTDKEKHIQNLLHHAHDLKLKILEQKADLAKKDKEFQLAQCQMCEHSGRGLSDNADALLTNTVSKELDIVCACNKKVQTVNDELEQCTQQLKEELQQFKDIVIAQRGQVVKKSQLVEDLKHDLAEALLQARHFKGEAEKACGERDALITRLRGDR